MRQRTHRRWVVATMAAAALAGLAPVLPAASAVQPVRQPAPPAAEPDFRLGFVSTSGPRVLRADLEDEVTDVSVAGLAQDPDSLFGDDVWIGFPVAGGVADPDGELFWRNESDRDDVRRLTTDGSIDRNPMLSPDESQIAFESDRGGNPDIWVINVDGSGLRQLTTDPAPDTWPAWAPDGGSIVYAGFADDPEGELYQVPASGGEPSRLTDSPGADIEPAWNPGAEGEITFTTTRFRAEGDIVVMPVAGGDVVRVVPDPFDSSQASWSPDGTRLAFVTRRNDPQGDVYLLEDGEVTPLATRPDTAETGPSQEGFGVFYTELGEGDGTFDVWDADRTGGDRVDLTNRPGLDETGPAWTADGLRLAYSEAQPDGGARIVVTDAAGRGRQVVAPPGTLDSDVDLDPTWSPDGTQIAFTRQQQDQVGRLASSTILIGRVEDGAELGRVPVPPGMSVLDGKPAWSPDGTRLAFERDGVTRVPPFVNEPPTDRPVNPSDAFPVDVSISVPTVPAHPDVVFLLDATESMADELEGIGPDLVTMMSNILGAQPDARFALATFRDLEESDPFSVLHPLSNNISSVRTAANAVIPLGGGGDEDWINALHQLATGAVDFLPGRTPVIVLIGDSPSHEPSGEHQLTEPPLDPDGADGDTMLALREAGVRVVAVDADGFDEGVTLDTDGQASIVTERTGGALIPFDEFDQELEEAVLAGLGDIPVSVVPEIESCEPGLSVAVAPDRRDLIGGQTATFTATTQVAADAPAGARLRCQIGFQLSDGSRTSYEIVVRVNDGVRPQVRVDDLVVTAEAGTSLVVDYAASAVAADGTPLTPTCTPPSGSEFPAGLTVVTCTATDPAGNTGTDTAAITVIAEDFQFSSRIWVATLGPPDPAAVTTTNQIDLTGRVPDICGETFSDLLAPAWSPDGTQLAYALVSEGSLLCVVDADGANPVVIDAPSFAEIADPAWAPDGELIAFGLGDFGDPVDADIWVVPPAGGVPTLLIGGAGEQRQPAYRPLPEPPPPNPPVAALALEVAVSPARGFVGGDDLTVDFTVQNRSSESLVEVELVLDPPDSPPLAASDDRCGAPTTCALGTMLPGATVTRTIELSPEEAVRAVVAGRVTGAIPGGPTATATDSAPVLVVAPELIVAPDVGPPGFVPLATGVNFPPDAEVELLWRVEQPADSTLPITSFGNRREVEPDGTFTFPALVFRKDILGERQLVAQRVDGPRFGEVSAEFLVVPRSLDPPEFEGRG